MASRLLNFKRALGKKARNMFYLHSTVLLEAIMYNLTNLNFTARRSDFVRKIDYENQLGN